MPFDNFSDRHFSEAEKTAVTDALTALETALNGKLANLTPEERQQYGSINEQNKRIVNKVKDYYDNNPDLSFREVDWGEFNADYDSRSVLENAMLRLEGIVDGLFAAKILHDWDNYKNSIKDYNYAKMMMKNSDNPAYETKVNEIAQFFTGGTPPDPEPEPEP